MKKNKSKIEPVTLILSILAGVMWLFVGNFLVNILLSNLWAPLVIAIYFGGLALVLILVTWLCTRLKGLCMPPKSAYPSAFLVVAGIFLAAGLFQIIYSITLTPRVKDSSSYIFLIDDSGSIYDPNELRESAVKQVMASCDSDFPYAVYGFTDTCWQISNMQAAEKAASTNLSFMESGTTDIVYAISAIVDEVKSGKIDAGDAPRILLITDGAAGKIGLRKTLRAAAEENISICTIGMPGDVDSMLQKIADLSGGVHIGIDNIDQLPAAVQGAAVSSSDYVRTLISLREPTHLDWIYSGLRIIFLLCLGAGYIWIKSLLLRTNDSDADVLIPNLVLVLVGALCIEVGMNILFLPENMMRLVMCIGFTVLLTKELRGSFSDFDEDEMYSQGNSSYYMGYGDSPVPSGSKESFSWENDSDWERN